MAARAPLRRNDNFFNQGGGAVASTEKKVQRAFQRCAESGLLNLSEQNLSGDLPSSVCNFQEASWAENWWEQYPVTKIDVSHNLVERIPPQIANLCDCTAFIAVSNRLKSLPDELFTALPLKQLNVKQNMLASLPGAALSQAEHLVELVVSENQLSDLPAEVFQISTLEVLEACGNRIQKLPESRWSCLHLKRLDISKNGLGPSLPAALSHCCPALRELLAAGNALQDVGGLFDIPANHGWCSSLVLLDLSLNQLGPSLRIAPMQSLDALNITSNRLCRLELGAGPFTQLSNVLAGTNRLEYFPEAFLPASAPRLNTIDLSNNSLVSLPAELGLSQSLKRVSLEGNALRSIRPELLRGGAEKLKAYLRSRLTGATEEPSTVEAFGGGLEVDLRTAAATKELNLEDRGLTSLPSLPADLCVMRLPCNSITSGALFTALFRENGNIGRALRIMNISRNCLGADSGPTNLMHSILQNLTSLRELDLSFNEIADLGMPKESVHSVQQSLVHVNLSGNSLTVLPARLLVSCPSLDELRLRQNRFESLDDISVAVGASLSTLDVEENSLNSVPPWLPTALPRLRTLLLANNSIGPSLPSEWGFWESLQSVSLSGNPLRSLRQSLLTSGWPALATYLRDRLPAGRPTVLEVPSVPVKTSPYSYDTAVCTHSDDVPSHPISRSSPTQSPTAAVTLAPSNSAQSDLAERIGKLRSEISSIEEEMSIPGLNRAKQSSLTHSLRMKRAEHIRVEKELKRLTDVAETLSKST